MEIKSIITKKLPEYPTEYYFINNPELYKDYIPKRWFNNKVVYTALSTFILAGMNNLYSDEQNNKPQVTVVKNATDSTKINKTQKVQGQVAPIFVHGEGSGSIGCVSTSPPVFITEKEAIEIIIQEFKDNNIDIDTINCPTIHIDGDSITANIDKKIDGINNQYNILIEYVSTNDYTKIIADKQNTKIINGKTVHIYSSVQGYNTKRTAEILRNKINNIGNYNIGIFYDPIVNDEKNEYSENPQNTAKKLLIKQVDDFITWLKDEGIIK